MCVFCIFREARRGINATGERVPISTLTQWCSKFEKARDANFSDNLATAAAAASGLFRLWTF